MAYVYKKGGKWYAGWKDESGVPTQESTGIPIGSNPTQERASRKKAQAYAEDLEHKAKRIRQGLDKPKKPEVLFEIAARRYLAEYARQLESFDTVRGRFENHWIPARSRAGEPTFGERFVTSLCAADIEAVLLQKKEEGYSPQSRKHLLNSLSGFYTWAITKAKMLEDDAENPCVHVDVQVPKRAPNPLKADWVIPIIQCFNDYDRAFAATAVMTGARAGELRHARVGDVDVERCCIRVTGSNAKDTPKDGEERVIGFPAELVPYLQLEVGRARSEWLFPGRNGRRRRKDEKLAEELRAAMVKAGIIEGYDHRCSKKCGYLERRADDAQFPCPKCSQLLRVIPIPPHYTFRDLRATWATIAGAQTKDWKAVQFQLGHADPRTTQRYERVGDDRVLGQARAVRFLPCPTNNGEQQVAYPILTGTADSAAELTGQQPETVDRSTGYNGSAQPLRTEEHRLRRPMLYPAELRAHVPSLSTASQLPDIAEVPRVDESRRLAPVVSIQQQVTYPALTDRFLTAQDAADLLRVARDTIYAWCKAGYLPSVRIGGSYRIRPSDLQALRLPPAPSPIRGATAANAAKTHCPKGHVLDGLRSDGHRYCKTCNNLREKARREKKGGTR